MPPTIQKWTKLECGCQSYYGVLLAGEARALACRDDHKEENSISVDSLHRNLKALGQWHADVFLSNFPPEETFIVGTEEEVDKWINEPCFQ